MKELSKNELFLLLDEDYDEIWRIGKKNRKPRPKPNPSYLRSMLAEELTQPEDEYKFTYKASNHEQQWIPAALETFYDDSLISDVLAMVKAGKEANVYCCKAHPGIGLDLLVAKIYRPRRLRNLKNDAMYKEGRPLLGDDGKPLQDHRSLRAVQRKTRIGKEMSITSWIEHEYQTMVSLDRGGVRVPKPIAQFENAILMEYIGKAGLPAPTLNTVTLERAEAAQLFHELMYQVERMLAHDLIHADLSAYNVLYWEGSVTIIDFPQVVDPILNPWGYILLARDIERLCQYFARYDIRANPNRLATDLWRSYIRGELRRGIRA